MFSILTLGSFAQAGPPTKATFDAAEKYFQCSKQEVSQGQHL